MAHYPALVLNADFSPLSRFPLSVWDFSRTMRNTLRERVSVLETYDVTLRSQRLVYRPPSVVALRSFVKLPTHVAFTRFNVFLRDDFRCQYCGGQFPAKSLTFDHVIPRVAGGGANWTNIVSACVPCNSKKGHGRSMRPLKAPRAPTAHELQAARKIPRETVHKTWLDYLYWSGALESD